MKRTLIIILFSVALMMSLCAGAFAEEAEHPVHECDGIVFDIPIHGLIRGTVEPGNYYLDGDCVLEGHVMIYGDVRMCLNGYSVSVEGATTFRVRRGGEFSIYDCSGKGIIGHYNTVLNNHSLTIDEGGTANIYGGWLYGMQGSNAVNSKGTVNVYGGRIESCSPGYCAVRNGCELNIFGGELIGFIGISQRIPGVINFCGNRFTISSSAVALQYIRDVSPLNVLTRFYRWRTDSGNEFTECTDAPFVPDKNILYLEFAPMTRNIEYVTDGGVLPEDAAYEYVCGEGCDLPDTLEKEGFRFIGWYDAPENGNRVLSVSENACDEIILYAVFEKLPEPAPEPEEEIAVPQEELQVEPEQLQETKKAGRSELTAAVITVDTVLVIVLAAAFVLLKKRNKQNTGSSEYERDR